MVPLRRIIAGSAALLAAGLLAAGLLVGCDTGQTADEARDGRAGSAVPEAVFRGDAVGSAAPVTLVPGSRAYPTFAAEWSLPLSEGTLGFDVGDVVGDREEEILIVESGIIRVFERTGRHIRDLQVPAPAASYGFLHDINDDGKQELVLGSQDDATARIRVMDGRGRIMASGTGGSLVRGITRPAFFAGGYVYFTAGSAFASTPRVIGRLHVRTEELEWLRRDGVIPHGLVYSGATENVGVHNRGTALDLPGSTSESMTPSSRSAVMTIGIDGSTQVFHPLGSPVQEGRRRAGAVGSVQSYPVQGPKGEQIMTFAVANRGSSFYAGSPRLLLYDESGNLQASFRGPAEDRASVWLRPTLAHAVAPSEPAVVAVWAASGLVQSFASDLTLQSELRLPGDVHNAALQYRGDLTGDGTPDLLVTDLNRLYLVDLHALSTTGEDARSNESAPHAGATSHAGSPSHGGSPSHAGSPSRGDAGGPSVPAPPGASTLRPATVAVGSFAKDISGVRPIAAGGTSPAGLLVRAGDLYYLTAEEGGRAGPPPAAFGDRSTELREAIAEHSFRGETARRGPLGIENAALLDRAGAQVIAALVDLEGLRLIGIGDLRGDPTPELLFLRDASTLAVTSLDLEIGSVFVLPQRCSYHTIVDDLDGDGNEDIVCVGHGDIRAVLAVAGDGEIIFRRPLFQAPDTMLRPLGVVHDRLFLSAVTGHMLTPRGVYALEPGSGRLDYFYPTAAFPQAVVAAGDRILIETYTPANGHRIDRADGFTDRDDTLFLHALTRDGAVDSLAAPLRLGAPGGLAQFVSLDANADGKPELYVVPRRDKRYNPGPTGVYRILPADGDSADSGETQRYRRVLVLPDDTTVMAKTVPVQAEDWLILRLRSADRTNVYDARLQFRASFQGDGGVRGTLLGLGDPSGVAFLGVVDGALRLDAVGSSERAEIAVEGVRFNRLWRAGWAAGAGHPRLNDRTSAGHVPAQNSVVVADGRSGLVVLRVGAPPERPREIPVDSASVSNDSTPRGLNP